MAKHGFLAKHGVVKDEVRSDLLQFAIPALVVFTAGLIFSTRDGWGGLIATLWGLVRDPRTLSLLSGPNLTGLVLIIAGFAIIAVALGNLRRSYASTLVIRKDHELVTRGIYRFTRHPIYLGVLMVCLGVSVYPPSLYGILTMSALGPIFLNRIRLEERLLAEAFGDAYRAYQETTRKLIPFVY